jgi:hypothetical protein
MTDETFDRLANLFAPYRAALVATADEPGNLYLETPPSARYPDGLYFGAVKIGKRYVSFHLMPVYTNPELLEGISPALRKRMQGKSCFNFTRPDEAMFEELKRLTNAGFAQFRADGLIPPG